MQSRLCVNYLYTPFYSQLCSVAVCTVPNACNTSSSIIIGELEEYKVEPVSLKVCAIYISYNDNVRVDILHTCTLPQA